MAFSIVLSSCSRTPTNSGELSLPESEAALLDPSVDSGALPVIDPSVSPDAFADLRSGTADADTVVEGPSDGVPFYNPLGGESLGRVAYMLYGSRNERKKLLDLNPGLKGVRALAPGQKVAFSFEGLRPNPQYLTKDLLDRYAQPLSQALRDVGQENKQNDVVVGRGESLQDVSRRLYGTTRYWPEIYLLNVDRLKHYDRVQAGATLAVLERSPIIVGSAPAGMDSQPQGNVGEQAIAPPAMAPALVETPPPSDLQPPAAPVMAPAAVEASPAAESAPPAPQALTTQPAPQDPIPETPMAGSAQNTESVASADEEGFLGSPTARRIFYVALVLIVGALGFYFTRPKQKSFDMIETATAASTGPSDSHEPPSRPKLPKAPPHQHLG
jgi:hypothetical protein